MAFSMKRLIDKKKRGGALSEDEIRAWVSRLSERSDDLGSDQIPAYQTAAMLMAIRFAGMNFEEITALTLAMADSGKRFNFPDHPILADKHSTGGVGDKVTLVLAPLMAACGLPVTMLSGRGLGHTGGTIDKFESLPDVRCNRDEGQMQAMLAAFGWANAQTTPNICPADRVLYQLRDVTATVDSIPLITASIMSKKIAGGASHLCLDVKAGAAAFMETVEQAKELAETMKAVGGLAGLPVEGLITRMNEPLGHAVGNYLELMESVSYLQKAPDTPLMQLIYQLGSVMLRQTGVCTDEESAAQRMQTAMTDGSALEKLLAYLRFNGGDEAAIDDLLKAKYDQFKRVAIVAESSGFVSAIHGRELGHLMVRIGAGREKADLPVDPHAGVVLEKHLGEAVEAGDVLLWVHGEKALADIDTLRGSLRDLYEINPEAIPEESIVCARF